MAITLGSNSARIGHALGTGLAQPIHQHLDLMAQQKLQEIQQNQLARQQHAERQRYAQGLAPLLGTPTAQFLSNLGPDERKSALQNLQVLMQFSENPRQQQQPQPTVRQLLSHWNLHRNGSQHWLSLRAGALQLPLRHHWKSAWRRGQQWCAGPRVGFRFAGCQRHAGARHQHGRD